jgi:hypothetical protein
VSGKSIGAGLPVGVMGLRKSRRGSGDCSTASRLWGCAG